MAAVLWPASTTLTTEFTSARRAIGKSQSRRYALRGEFATFWAVGLPQPDFRILPIDVRHTTSLTNLPFDRKDPFDRLLAEQVLTDGLTLVSTDAIFDSYGVTRVW
jgi:PIN domain nuclease of toxin-antitoxin system